MPFKQILIQYFKQQYDKYCQNNKTNLNTFRAKSLIVESLFSFEHSTEQGLCGRINLTVWERNTNILSFHKRSSLSRYSFINYGHDEAFLLLNGFVVLSVGCRRRRDFHLSRGRDESDVTVFRNFQSFTWSLVTLLLFVQSKCKKLVRFETEKYSWIIYQMA